MLKSGLYEQVINKKFAHELDLATDQLKSTALIDKAEASKVLAKYIAEIIEKGLDNVKDKGGDIRTQIDKIVRKVTQKLAQYAT